MRASFGDYRAKMDKEEKKFKLGKKKEEALRLNKKKYDGTDAVNNRLTLCSL